MKKKKKVIASAVIASAVIAVVISTLLGLLLPYITKGQVEMKYALLGSLMLMPVIFIIFLITFHFVEKKQEEQRRYNETLSERNEELAKQREIERIKKQEELFAKQLACTAHDYETVGITHPYNTGQAVRTAKCKLCGKYIEEDYGWDDNW